MSTSGAPFYPRLAATGTVLATLAALMALRLGYLAFSDRARALAAEGGSRRSIPAQRGSIWDRNGALLAADTFVFDAGLNTAGLDAETLAAVAAKVGPRFGKDPAWIVSRAEEVRQAYGINWVGLAIGLSLEEGQSLRTAQENGDESLSHVEFSRQAGRVYPLGADGLQVLGMLVGNDDPSPDAPAMVGSHGIEARYRALLDGTPGQSGGLAGGLADSYLPAQAGMDLRLTIDRQLQQAAAAALRETLTRQDASGGTVLVMETRTGAILASVSAPSFDPNRRTDLKADLLKDPACADHYEPGSVLKIMTVAAGLESGAITADSHYQDDGVVSFAGMNIRNWDLLAHGWTSMSQMLQDSLNVGAVWVATRTGPERFYAELDDFGFGQPTGVDVSGELPGVLHHPGDVGWYDGFLASNSFGHSIDATPIQVLSAINAVANGGLLMKPFLVAERIPAEGPSLITQPEARRQVISPANASILRQMMQEVVVNHATAAAIPGYSVGGKTGTTELIDRAEGRYDDHETIASFCGFIPVDRPVVTICAKVDRPDGQRGSEVAAPLFGEVARAAIHALRIPADRPEAAR